MNAVMHAEMTLDQVMSALRTVEHEPPTKCYSCGNPLPSEDFDLGHSTCQICLLVDETPVLRREPEYRLFI